SGPSCSTAAPVLQVPAWPLLEGDEVTLHCRVMQKESYPVVNFYHNGKRLWWHFIGTEMSLSPLQLHDSGHYHCSVRRMSRTSAAVTVTVHGEHPHTSA
ncbi:FCRLA protein, partial [Pycnonotus jocosus]|nr:FCRLA protein [Pycnonotus jocosus]